MRKVIFCFILLLSIVLIQCAASVRISDIRDNPSQFQNKKVTIGGTVDEALTLPILGVGVYQLNDGTGKIWVKPEGTVPEKGEDVMVTGTLKVGLTISGRSFGLILIESENDELY